MSRSYDPRGELSPFIAAFFDADLVKWPVVGGVAGAKDCLTGVANFSSLSTISSSMSVGASSAANSRSRSCFAVGNRRRGLIEARVDGRRRGEAGPSISVSSELKFG